SAALSYSTTGSLVLNAPPHLPLFNPVQIVLISAGPNSDAPVVLLKTCQCRLMVSTTCVAPTDAFVSGGATPSRLPIPSKFSPIVAPTGGSISLWIVASPACSSPAGSAIPRLPSGSGWFFSVTRGFFSGYCLTGRETS